MGLFPLENYLKASLGKAKEVCNNEMKHTHSPLFTIKFFKSPSKTNSSSECKNKYTYIPTQNIINSV